VSLEKALRDNINTTKLMKQKTLAAGLGIALGALLAILAGVVVFLTTARSVLSNIVLILLALVMYLPQTPVESDPLIRMLTLGLFSCAWGVFVVLPAAILGGFLGKFLL
jgi:uncharacterized protein YacL